MLSADPFVDNGERMLWRDRMTTSFSLYFPLKSCGRCNCAIARDGHMMASTRRSNNEFSLRMVIILKRASPNPSRGWDVLISVGLSWCWGLPIVFPSIGNPYAILSPFPSERLGEAII